MYKNRVVKRPIKTNNIAILDKSVSEIVPDNISRDDLYKLNNRLETLTAIPIMNLGEIHEFTRKLTNSSIRMMAFMQKYNGYEMCGFTTRS
jgi:hypothetical protein